MEFKLVLAWKVTVALYLYFNTTVLFLCPLLNGFPSNGEKGTVPPWPDFLDVLQRLPQGATRSDFHTSHHYCHLEWLNEVWMKQKVRAGCVPDPDSAGLWDWALCGCVHPPGRLAGARAAQGRMLCWSQVLLLPSKEALWLFQMWSLGVCCWLRFQLCSGNVCVLISEEIHNFCYQEVIKHLAAKPRVPDNKAISCLLQLRSFPRFSCLPREQGVCGCGCSLSADKQNSALSAL